MMGKLFFKIFIGLLLVTLFLTALIFVTSLQAAQYYYHNRLSAAMSDLSVAMSYVASPLMGAETGRVQDIIEEARIGSEMRIVVLDAEGKVLADSAPDSTAISGIASKREFINALNGVVGSYSDTDDPSGNHILSATAPIRRGGDIVGVVMIRQPVTTGIASIPPILFSAVCVFVLLFAVLGAVIISSHLSTPIRELSGAAKRVSEGDFTARVFLDRNDEIKYLADRFNYMTERIDFLFGQVTHQKDELLQIISGLDEGLVVVDRGDRMVLFNERFGDIAHERPVVGRYYWEALRDPKVSELVAVTKKDKQNRREQIEINDRAYTCSTIHIPSSDGIIIVLHDITDISGLEQMKREFVSNVSHELRTPLTAIKGFVETIEETDAAGGSPYLKIIKRNTERMISIIKDLLALSEFDEKSVVLHLEAVNVGQMVRGILATFDREIKRKDLKATVVAEQEPIIISADSFRLEQLFINLIENAIKYTERGGIVVRLSRSESLFSARVEDSGIGIARHDLSRIFERFYRADKSRSRSLGGTGLGLSIVKYIALLHNGDVGVESTEGVGTTFTVTIPQPVRGQPPL